MTMTVSVPIRYGTNAIFFMALRILSLFLVQHGALFEVTNNHMQTTMQYYGINSVNGSNKLWPISETKLEILTVQLSYIAQIFSELFTLCTGCPKKKYSGFIRYNF
jgi:hypothetical protein